MAAAEIAIPSDNTDKLAFLIASYIIRLPFKYSFIIGGAFYARTRFSVEFSENMDDRHRGSNCTTGTLRFFLTHSDCNHVSFLLSPCTGRIQYR